MACKAPSRSIVMIPTSEEFPAPLAEVTDSIVKFYILVSRDIFFVSTSFTPLFIHTYALHYKTSIPPSYYSYHKDLSPFVKIVIMFERLEFVI
jgi:hypothetical protein